MAANIITTEDLQSFRIELLEEIKKLLLQRHPVQTQRWLKSHQVRRMLTISPGTLQNLRINGTMPFTKIGGVIFYDAQDIEKMLLERKHNTESSQQKTQLRR
jgi:hypothetical protein